MVAMLIVAEALMVPVCPEAKQRCVYKAHCPDSQHQEGMCVWYVWKCH